MEKMNSEEEVYWCQSVGSSISGKDFEKLSKGLVDKISRFFENNLKIESEPVH